MNPVLIYIHIGKDLPKCLFDSLYQTILINRDTTKIYVILDECVIPEFNARIRAFNINSYLQSPFQFNNIINLISINTLNTYLDTNDAFLNYKNNVKSKVDAEFRNGFWVSTTMRFFYINALIDMFHLHDVFHIENDVMMYIPFINIYEQNIEDLASEKRVWMVKDAPDRVIPSLLYFPDGKCCTTLTKFIAETTQSSTTFMNDMSILGLYNNAYFFPIFPEVDRYIYDGAAIGQYLGGIDIRNIPHADHPEAIFRNNTVGFINETSVFKPDSCVFAKGTVKTDIHKAPIKLITCKPIDDTKISLVANLHVHSKQLYQFSSVFDTGYADIVTGDRIVSLCDFVITTREIYAFHKNLDNFANEVLIVNDWNRVNMEKINKYFRDFCLEKQTRNIKLFVYTHILENFMKRILENLDKQIQYTIYCHNSDHSFDSQYKNILDAEHIVKVFAQNIDYPYHSKLNFLPIGLANSMWKHGDVLSLYKTIRETYTQKKTKSIYVNINPNTFGYRREVLRGVQETKCWDLSDSKPFKDYLYELSEHRFCFALRGNGISSHRFWESLYLGVIPVIINNSHTRMKYFVDYLRTLDIPFYEITEESFDIISKKYTKEFFNEELYNSIIAKLDTSMYLLKSLKLNYYV